MANKKFLRVFPDGSVTVLDLGDMEIWDGADMALLRESLTRLIKGERRRAIGIVAHLRLWASAKDSQPRVSLSRRIKWNGGTDTTRRRWDDVGL